MAMRPKVLPIFLSLSLVYMFQGVDCLLQTCFLRVVLHFQDVRPIFVITLYKHVFRFNRLISLCSSSSRHFSFHTFLLPSLIHFNCLILKKFLLCQSMEVNLLLCKGIWVISNSSNQVLSVNIIYFLLITLYTFFILLLSRLCSTFYFLLSLKWKISVQKLLKQMYNFFNSDYQLMKTISDHFWLPLGANTDKLMHRSSVYRIS